MVDKRIDTSSFALRARRWESLWLCGLILSFAYERPLFNITSYDRINPRLFDIFVLLGVLTVLPHLSKNVRPPHLFRNWAMIVSVFCLCAIIWAIFILPWEYGKFSVFFALKYLEGLIAIYISLRIPLDSHQKQTIHYFISVGGIFVAIYTIYQFNYGSNIIEIVPGKFVRTTLGSVTGPLGYAYFHIAQFSSLAFIMTLGLITYTRNKIIKIIYSVLAIFVAWPLFYSGSRTGLGLIAISFPIVLLLNRKLRGSMAIVILCIFLLILGTGINVSKSIHNSTALTIQRFLGIEQTKSPNRLISRLTLPKRFTIEQYRWKGLSVPLIGAGFYVAPVYTGGWERYRVGYGIHNAYLFALEQGGLFAFILFIVFVIRLLKNLNKMRNAEDLTDSTFAVGMFAFFIALLLAGMAGLVFWMGVGTVHFNVYLVLLLLMACRPKIS